VLEAFAALPQRDAILVMACRAKTAGAREAEQQLRAQAEQLGIAPRVVWIGETNAIHTLLAAVDVVLLPTDTLYAKMDYPLVILEAMSLAKPVVVGLGTPAEELCVGGAALATEVSRDAVLDVMTRLVEDASLRAEHGGRGRERVLSEYTRAPMAAAYEALYDALCA
jgi:glycosyltransferase involved in cell wall biosynthesis